MLPLFVLIALIATVTSDEDCGCASSDSSLRENLFECIEPLQDGVNFSPDFYDRDMSLRTGQDRTIFMKSARYMKYFRTAKYFKYFRAASYMRYMRYYMRSAYMKRQANDGMDMCDCLRTTAECLDSSSCDNALSVICNLASGRLFSYCEECRGLSSMREQYQSVSQMVEKIETLETSLEEYIDSSVSLLSDLDFEFTAGTVHVTATLTAGTTELQACNNIAFYLSQALDVFPGAISCDTSSAKRQADLSAHLVFVDEEEIAQELFQSSASTQVVGVLALVTLALRVF